MKPAAKIAEGRISLLPTYRTTKIARRKARAARKQGLRYGKRSARVRAQNLANRREYVESFGANERRAYLNGRRRWSP